MVNGFGPFLRLLRSRLLQRWPRSDSLRAGFFFLGALERVSERFGVLGLGKRNAQDKNLFIFLARRFQHSASSFVYPFADQIKEAREEFSACPKLDNMPANLEGARGGLFV